MKVMKNALIICSAVASFAPNAAVNVEFHRDISPIVVGGEEIGFSVFSKSEYTIPDGVNQLVLQVSKLVEKHGEREKFNSKAFVLTFDQENTKLFIEPDGKLARVEQAEAFNEKPSFLVTDDSGAKIDFTVAELPSLGGISRDYEKELAKFNAKNNPELVVASTTTTAAVASNIVVESKQVSKDTSSEEQTNMFGYWLEKANKQEIEQFTQLAFESRNKSDVSIPSDASQPLQMLAYWFNQANNEERKSILSHLVSL